MEVKNLVPIKIPHSVCVIGDHLYSGKEMISIDQNLEEIMTALKKLTYNRNIILAGDLNFKNSYLHGGGRI